MMSATKIINKMDFMKKRFSTALITFFFVFSVGCQDYVFEPVLSGFITSVSREVHIPLISNVDMLFVMDDSGSMTGNQANVARNLDHFIQLFEDRNAQRELDDLEPLDFQIGVASTSILQNIVYDGDLFASREYAQRSDDSCLEGSAYDIVPGTPYPEGELMAAGNNYKILTTQHFRENKQDAIRQFRENIRLGACGSGQEQGFEAMRRVLVNNPEFFREQSRLVVIFISDEEDCSDMTDSFVSYIISSTAGQIDTRLDPDYNHALTPVETYKRYLDDLAFDRKGSVAIASIVSAVGDPPHDMEPGLCFDEICAAECPETDEQRIRHQPCWCGGHTPGGRYLELARMYSPDDHIMDSICQHDFSDTLGELVRIAEVDQCLQLGARPNNDDTSLVLVRIERTRDDGEVEQIVCSPPASPGEQACDAGADWWYDPRGPTLCLCPDSACVLLEGDQYRLSIVEEACSTEHPCN